jgi:hypothetical protein
VNKDKRNQKRRGGGRSVIEAKSQIDEYGIHYAIMMEQPWGKTKSYCVPGSVHGPEM